MTEAFFSSCWLFGAAEYASTSGLSLRDTPYGSRLFGYAEYAVMAHVSTFGLSLRDTPCKTHRAHKHTL